MLRLEGIDLPRCSPAPVCGRQIHSARQKHPLPGWPSPGWHFQPTPTQAIGSRETQDGFVSPDPSYGFLLYLHAYACGCVWRERVRENERKSERTRERKRDGPSLLSGSIQLIHFNASSSLSVDLGALCHTEMWSSQRGIAQCSSCPSHSRDQESL